MPETNPTTPRQRIMAIYELVQAVLKVHGVEPKARNIISNRTFQDHFTCPSFAITAPMVWLELGTTAPDYTNATWPEDVPWLQLTVLVPGKDARGATPPLRVILLYDPANGSFQKTVKVDESENISLVHYGWLEIARRDSEDWRSILNDESDGVLMPVSVIRALDFYLATCKRT